MDKSALKYYYTPMENPFDSRENRRKHTDGMKVVFNPKVKEMVDELSSLLDVKITFFSLDKKESLVGYHSMESDYCTLLQENLGLIKRCNKQDEKAYTKCKKDGESKIYQCHAGLTEIMIPIKDDNSKESKLIGFAIIGQFRNHNTIPENLLIEWKEHGYDSKTLTNAFLERPYYDDNKTLEIANLIKEIIELNIKTENLRLKRPELIEEIYTYIDDNISNDISIDELSNAISRSKSSIAHRLKESTGKSFKELLISKRLDRFEEILRNDPDISIKYAAAQVGFQDQLYLSRVYKRVKKLTPTEYRKKIREEINKAKA